MTFTYDATSQLTAADHSSQTDETYGFDANGNRNSSGFTIGTNNQTTESPDFTYTYDDEGNRTSRTETASGEVTEYMWDYRNRLIVVKDRTTSGGSVVKQVDYEYDAFNRLVKRTYDADGAGSGSATSQYWVYDEGINAVLQFDGSGASNVSHRYLWTNEVDELIADEQIGSDTLYGLGDHLGTIRDIANFNEGTSVTNGTNHRKYSAFGKLVSESNTAVDLIFGFTGKQLDEATGLQHNLNRWYDSDLGQWLSEDPIGFNAGDENVRRYVGNTASNAIDPNGLEKWLLPWDPGASWDPRKTLGLWFSHTPSEHLQGLYTTDTEEKPWTNGSLGAAGESYIQNAGNAHATLEVIDHFDPTGLASGTSQVLEILEGEELHNLVGQNTNQNLVAVNEVLDFVDNFNIPRPKKPSQNLGATPNAPSGGVPGSYRPPRPLPRDQHGNMVPDSPYPHTQLGTEQGRKVGDYTAAREFGENGQWNRDIHFTDHGRPQNHTNPHQHLPVPQPTGGTPGYGPSIPFDPRNP